MGNGWADSVLQIEFWRDGQILHTHISPAVPRVGEHIKLGGRGLPTVDYRVKKVTWAFADQQGGGELKPGVIVELEDVDAVVELEDVDAVGDA